MFGAIAQMARANDSKSVGHRFDPGPSPRKILKSNSIIDRLAVCNYYNSNMTFEKRPWGNFTVIHKEPTYQIKQLVVHPGMRISLQSHEFRAEHWFIVSGQGVVELDGAEIHLKSGGCIDVPIGIKHRITCAGDIDLVFVEIQTGTSFAEKDIVRYEDDFGRK